MCLGNLAQRWKWTAVVDSHSAKAVARDAPPSPAIRYGAETPCSCSEHDQRPHHVVLSPALPFGVNHAIGPPSLGQGTSPPCRCVLMAL